MSRFRLRCRTMGPLTCVSEVTNENSVTSPVRTHATSGKRVFTEEWLRS